MRHLKALSHVHPNPNPAFGSAPWRRTRWNCLEPDTYILRRFPGDPPSPIPPEPLGPGDDSGEPWRRTCAPGAGVIKRQALRSKIERPPWGLPMSNSQSCWIPHCATATRFKRSSMTLPQKARIRSFGCWPIGCSGWRSGRCRTHQANEPANLSATGAREPQRTFRR